VLGALEGDQVGAELAGQIDSGLVWRSRVVSGGHDDDFARGYRRGRMRRRRRGHRPQRAQVARRMAGELPVRRERRDLTYPLVGVGPHRRICRLRRIDATDGVEGVLRTVVVPLGIAAVVLVGQGQQVTGIGATSQTEQAAGEEFPELRRVQRVDGARGRIGVTSGSINWW
jgi:hypothetical protein